MGPVSVVRRAGRLALVLLLVAVLAAVGVSAPLSASEVSGDADAGVAVGGSRVDAMAPSRAAGRLLAEPSLVSVHGPADGVPAGATPDGLPPVDVVALGGDPHATGAVAPGVACRGMAGVRAPPAQRSVL